MGFPLAGAKPVQRLLVVTYVGRYQLVQVDEKVAQPIRACKQLGLGGFSFVFGNWLRLKLPSRHLAAKVYAPLVKKGLDLWTEQELCAGRGPCEVRDIWLIDARRQVPPDHGAKLVIDFEPLIEKIEDNLLSGGPPLKERDDSDESGDEGGHPRDHVASPHPKARSVLVHQA